MWGVLSIYEMRRGGVRYYSDAIFPVLPGLETFMVRKISRFIKFMLVLAILGLAGLTYYATRPLPLAHAPVDFEIARGDSMRVISQRVEEAGIGVWPPLLTWGTRLSGHAIRIKAGSYRVEQPISLWNLIGLLSTGSNAYADLTLVEGWSFARARAAMNAHPDLRHDTLGLSDEEVMQQLARQQRYRPAESGVCAHGELA